MGVKDEPAYNHKDNSNAHDTRDALQLRNVFYLVRGYVRTSQTLMRRAMCHVPCIMYEHIVVVLRRYFLFF